jgi:hypothetical protein
MTLQPTIPSDTNRRSAEDSFKDSLAAIQAILDRENNKVGDPAACEVLGEELRRLHARFRAHDAAGYFSHLETNGPVPPEYMDQAKRLCGEHRPILGQLDWLVRNVGSISDRALEDQEVFVLRARELIAVLRRHEAEENRVFFLAMWRETGGEGG